MDVETVTIKVICTDLPGLRFEDIEIVREPVYLGIQKGETVIDQVPGDRRQATFQPDFRIGRRRDGAPNFLGPYAKGTPAKRFFYLSWGVRQVDGSFDLFRRLKVWLEDITRKQVDKSRKIGKPITVRLQMTDAYGGPSCGSTTGDIRGEV